MGRSQLISAAAASLFLALFAGLAADARADNYYQDPTSTGNTIDHRSKNGHDEIAWKGPRVIVRGNTTNSDYYYCIGADVPTRWVAVADDADSANRSFTSTSDAYGANKFGYSYYSVTTTNWSSSDINIRVVSACTDDLNGNTFPYVTGTFIDWLFPWIYHLFHPDAKLPGQDEFDWLVQHALGWGSGGSASSATAGRARSTATHRKGGRRFALRNGSNTVTLRFKQPKGSRRPPAIYLATQPAGAHCAARRMHTSVIDGVGSAVLTLACHGVTRGTTARFKIRKAIRRNIRLDKGDGTLRIHLDKPPGKVEPLVYVNARPADTPCRVRHRHLDKTRTTLDLRIDVHCGRVSRKAVGRIYVGGLLAPDVPVP
jgi:hypothetical protein